MSELEPWQRTDRLVRSFLDRFEHHFPAKAREEARHYLEHVEWGLAMEELASSAVHEQLVLPPPCLEAFREVVIRMQMDEGSIRRFFAHYRMSSGE